MIHRCIYRNFRPHCSYCSKRIQTSLAWDKAAPDPTVEESRSAIQDCSKSGIRELAVDLNILPMSASAVSLHSSLVHQHAIGTLGTVHRRTVGKRPGRGTAGSRKSGNPPQKLQLTHLDWLHSARETFTVSAGLNEALNHNPEIYSKYASFVRQSHYPYR